MPRRILGSKRKDVTGGWRELHNEELPLAELLDQPSDFYFLKKDCSL